MDVHVLVRIQKSTPASCCLSHGLLSVQSEQQQQLTASIASSPSSRDSLCSPTLVTHSPTNCSHSFHIHFLFLISLVSFDHVSMQVLRYLLCGDPAASCSRVKMGCRTLILVLPNGGDYNRGSRGTGDTGGGSSRPLTSTHSEDTERCALCVHLCCLCCLCCLCY